MNITYNGFLCVGNSKFENVDSYPSYSNTKEREIKNCFDEDFRSREPRIDFDTITEVITESIYLVSSEEVIKLLFDDINSSSIEISNLVILRDYSNPKSGISINGVVSSRIYNNTFEELIKEGDEYPKNREFYMKVNEEDIVIKSKTDWRGYPSSCGVDNKNKDIVIVVKGKKADPIKVSLYDTEHCYGFDFEFADESELDSFMKLNPRYEKRQDLAQSIGIQNQDS